MIRVSVNGVVRNLAEDSTVEAVVRTTTESTRAVAVARNGAVVPRGEWARTRLADGDEIEILAPTAGG